MSLNEGLELISLANEATQNAWNVYQAIVLAFLGFVISNRTVTRNVRVKFSILAAFLVFTVYSAGAMHSFQVRKLALWEYVGSEVLIETEARSRNAQLYLDTIKPTSPGTKVFTQLLFSGFVLAALYYIPAIRREEETT